MRQSGLLTGKMGEFHANDIRYRRGKFDSQQYTIMRLASMGYGRRGRINRKRIGGNIDIVDVRRMIGLYILWYGPVTVCKLHKFLGAITACCSKPWKDGPLLSESRYKDNGQTPDLKKKKNG